MLEFPFGVLNILMVCTVLIYFDYTHASVGRRSQTKFERQTATARAERAGSQ